MSRQNRTDSRSRASLPPPGVGAPRWLAPWLATLAALAALAACNTESPGRGARHWVRCTCSYISDFDEPGAAPIDVCTEGHAPEEVAAACVRNDGVGVPTGCRCDAPHDGPCAKSDRCRAVGEAPR